MRRTDKNMVAQAPSPVQNGSQATTEFEKRQRKLPHWEQPGAVYFITITQPEDTSPPLTHPLVANILTRALHHGDGKRYDLYAYVLMPDHVHMIIRPLKRGKGTVPLSEIMQSLKGATAHRVNSALQRRGQLWLDESYDRIIRDKEEYREKMRYLEANPVRAGLVERADQWAWTWPPLRDEGPAVEGA